MNTEIRKYLIELARKRTNQTVAYQKLSDDCKLGLDMRGNPSDRKKIGNMLAEISINEFDRKRPLLSSLVLRANDGEEGEGFYKLAEQLGFGTFKNLKKDGIFEFSQIKECIEFWSNDKNYFLYKDD